ncbi:hypothetical protein K457DRAFT_12351 [Linnemannia elongata AG-77]|uniref:Uncharacterized protein n=1 Tax=Linnemannia elongata AG-77 TaxID=1314771 RepID=A0A197KJE8_9FUNG|nr:hypothetical protein K457DRAFT_12351 [Linnemannia elongata AG-77]
MEDMEDDTFLAMADPMPNLRCWSSTAASCPTYRSRICTRCCQGSKSCLPTIAPWKVKKLTVDSIMLPLPRYCSAVKTLSFRLGLICYCDSWDDKGVSGPEGQRLLAQLRGMPSLKTIILFVTEFTHMDEYSPDRLIYSEFNTQGVVGPNSVRDRKSDSKQVKWTLEEILNLI